MRPRPHSPASNAFFQPCDRSGVAVGHDHLADRRPGAGSDVGVRRRRIAIVCSTSPSRGPARPAATTSATRTRLPSTREARPLGLGDLERPQVGTRSGRRPRGSSCRARAASAPTPWSTISRTSPARHVDERQQSLDRAGRSRCRLGLSRQYGDAADDPPVLLGGDAEVAGRPRVDLDLVEVGDAPAWPAPPASPGARAGR